jgi:hypothetical protein
MSLNESAPEENEQGTETIASASDFMNLLNESFKAIEERMTIMSQEIKELKIGSPKKNEKKNNNFQSSDSEDGDNSFFSLAPNVKGANKVDSEGNSLPTTVERSKDNKNRRTTMYGQVVKQSTSNSDLKQVVMYEQVPQHNIRLYQLDIASVVKFMDGVYEYQAKYNVQLKIPTLIEGRAKEYLMARNFKYFNQRNNNFYSVSTEDLMTMIEQAVKPESVAAFRELIVNNVKFTQFTTYTPAANNFKPMYDALLLYRRQFMLYFNLMSSNNETNVPACTNKDGGLIRLFLKAIPFEYGDKVYTQLMVKNKSFTDFEDFIDQFYKLVYSNYKAALDTATLQFMFPIKTNMNFAFQNARVAHDKASQPKRFAVNNIPDVNIGDEELIEDPFVIWEAQQTNEYSETLSEFPPLASQEEKENGEAEVYGRRNTLREDERLLNAVTTHKPFAPTPQQPVSIFKDPSKHKACLGKILGTCIRSDSECRFSHDTAICKTECAIMIKRLSSSSFAPDNKFKLNALELTQESLHQLHMVYVNNNPQVSLVNAVYKDVKVKVSNNQTYHLLNVLFDSGSLHGSFASLDWVNSKRSELKSCIRPCHATAVLADGGAQIQITECIDLELEFVDSKQGMYVSLVTLLIANIGTNDMIIGLPDIIHKFGKLFISMISDVLQQPTQPSNNMGENVHISLNQLSLEPSLFATQSTNAYPWQTPVIVAPEDENTPLPCSATAWLNHIDTQYDKKVSDYHSQIEEHVSKEFRDSTDIVKLLQSPEVIAVFCPKEWTGINGVEPVHIEFNSALPERVKPPHRHINPKLLEHAKLEFNRLSGYFYRPSTSPVASPIVIAPKATAPYIRFCGDYVFINKYITVGHFPMPRVQHELEKIKQFSVFADLDWTNAYHQLRLDAETSRKLSVVVFGEQVEPVFMPEGVGPASGILQKVVSDLFGDFEKFTIAIYDNLLVLAHDYVDLISKLKVIFKRCFERNVILKFAKSWLGFDHANFFGYVCKKDKYELSDERKASIKDIPFPKTLKGMQRFLGSALFFSPFIPDYSRWSAPFNDTTKKTFNWDDESTWKHDYRSLFEEFKVKLTQAIAIHYPDYELEWFLQTDASDVGAGAMLVQKKPATATEPEKLEVIGLASMKFSPAALNYTTIEKEAYGIYFGVKSFMYNLQCKHFTLQTDHNNLIWIEQSIVPKIVRWRMFLQIFSFTLQHIKGSLNVVADYLSRLHINTTTIEDEGKDEEEKEEAEQLTNKNVQSADATTTPTNSPAINTTATEKLSSVHGGRNGHFGVARTWNDLNEYFPGHGVSIQQVRDFIAECPTCQKDRLLQTNTIGKEIRHLHPDNIRSRIGIDTLTITPPDSKGNQYLIVIVNHFSKFTYGYATASKDEETVAGVIFLYFVTFGYFDELQSDPGSEFMNGVVARLNKWLGFRHSVSLVDVKTSNGVEGSNKQILRHMKALALDERIGKDWSDITVLPWIFYILNSTYSSESGKTPYELHFGTSDALYYALEEHINETEATNAYIVRLDNNLKLLRQISKEYQEQLVKKRIEKETSQAKNKYQSGDYVLMVRDKSKPFPNKLSTKKMGPFVVVSQTKNDVTIKSLTHGNIVVAHVDRLEAFFGSHDDALKMARYDDSQYEVDRITAYRGEPNTRTTMEFYVLFNDGTHMWIPYNNDISSTLQFESYCRSKPELWPLLYKIDIAAQLKTQLNKSAITEIQTGDTVYVDIRSYGSVWYQSLQLPDKDNTEYVIPMRCLKLTHNGTKAELRCDLYKITYVFDHNTIKSYGSRKMLTKTMTIVTEEMCKQEPLLRINTKSKHTKQ